MSNIIKRDKLLQDIADGLNYHKAPPGGVWRGVTLGHIGVVFWAGDEYVLAAELYEALGYLVNDIYYNADSNWSAADRAEVCPM